MGKRTIMAAVALTLATASGAGAQIVAWDSPLLVPPRAQPGFGIFVAEPAFGELGALATYRPGNAPLRLQFRLGIAETEIGGPGDDEEFAVFGGADVSGLIQGVTSDFPVDLAWAAGAGLGIGDDVLASFPLGLIVGRSFSSEGVAFTPYVSPRVILDAFFGDAAGDDLELELALDVGLDLNLDDDFVIRFGGTVGDHEALALGVVF